MTYSEEKEWLDVLTDIVSPMTALCLPCEFVIVISLKFFPS